MSYQKQDVFPPGILIMKTVKDIPCNVDPFAGMIATNLADVVEES